MTEHFTQAEAMALRDSLPWGSIDEFAPSVIVTQMIGNAAAEKLLKELEGAEDLSFMDAEDAMFAEIDINARKSYRRYKSSARGQMLDRADTFDSHIIWATLKWAKEHQKPQTQDTLPAQQDHVQDIASFMALGGYNGVGTDQLVARIKDEFCRLSSGLMKEQKVNAQLVEALKAIADSEIKAGLGLSGSFAARTANAAASAAKQCVRPSNANASMPAAWVREYELKELETESCYLLSADSPRLWAPYEISSPPPEMEFVPLYRNANVMSPDSVAVLNRYTPSFHEGRLCMDLSDAGNWVRFDEVNTLCTAKQGGAT